MAQRESDSASNTVLWIVCTLAKMLMPVEKTFYVGHQLFNSSDKQKELGLSWMQIKSNDFVADAVTLIQARF